MKIYHRGNVYNEHIISTSFFNMVICTKKNISGTYTKWITFPGFYFGRNHNGVQLKIFGKIIWNSHS